jgi:uncharacterized membrane protein
VVDSDEHSEHPRRHLRQGKGRMEAISDGVFAVAMTLLVLDLAIPFTRGSGDLAGALVDEWPGYLGFLVSFATIGAIWLGHNTMTEYLDHVNPVMLRLNLLLLFFVCLLPFATGLLAEFINTERAERVASVVYGIMLLLCSVLLSAVWRYAVHAKLVAPDLDDDEISLLTSRLTPGLGVYVLLIVIGLFFPKVSVFGYLAVAVFLLLPFRPTLSRRAVRERRAARRRRAG